MKWAVGPGGGGAGGRLRTGPLRSAGKGSGSRPAGVICSLSCVYMEPLGHYVQLLTHVAKLQLMHHLTFAQDPKCFEGFTVERLGPTLKRRGRILSTFSN